ncbi:bifunctional diguanylate cyclase/phosphohydrolase [Haloplasma contractile]|nr:diguanylate cyclase [Haloplasma contractile]
MSYRFITILLSALVVMLASKQKKYQKSIEDNGYIDSITEAFNHRYFQERLDLELLRINRNDSTLGTIMIDIDNFSKFNETFSHRVGDHLLKFTSDVIKSELRLIDIVCRYGADEFIVILPDIKKNQLLQLSEQILTNFNQSILKEHQFNNIKDINVSLSMGFTIYPEVASNRNELISQSEYALHHAKQTGRSNIKIYRDVFNDIRTILSSTERELMTSLRTLLGTVSAKDRYTLGHSERVMDYVIKIGKQMNLDQNRIKILKIAALLHDIGKVEIPQQVLNKKGKLTEEEFEMIRQHPVYSADIVEPLAGLGELYKIIKHHHERIDGRGYPSQLAGDEIPLESRILTVADSFDAMLSSRPYKEPLDYNQAIEELKNCSGKQFDEEVVQAFIMSFNTSEIKENELNN